MTTNTEELTPDPATSAVEVADDPARTKTPRFGYTGEERKMTCREVVRAEDRAQNEVEHHYPAPDPLSESYSQEALDEALESQMEYYNEHAPEYKAEVAGEFGLTTKRLLEIIAEGTEKEWPLPPPPTPVSD